MDSDDEKDIYPKIEIHPHYHRVYRSNSSYSLPISPSEEYLRAKQKHESIPRRSSLNAHNTKKNIGSRKPAM